MANEKELLSKQEILMNEDALISGLLEAANYKTDESVVKTVRIQRPTGKLDANGEQQKKLLFQFHIRPLGEDELFTIRKQSTKYSQNPNGPKFPRIEGEIRIAEFRSRKIYAATVKEDREKLWNNQKVRNSLGAMEGWEVIDQALMAAEKDAVLDLIDEISGENTDLTDYLKN